MRSRQAAALLMVLAFGLAAAGGATGQSPPPRIDDREPLPPAPGWVADFTMLSANALVGAVTAGVVRYSRGGSFQEGFTRGFLGGGIVYGGKRLAVERFPGAGLVGRQAGAVGASMVRNAGDGVPAMERLILPLGPIRLYLDRSAGSPIRAKADLNTLVLIGIAAAERDLSFDASASLSAGAPVFVARRFLFEETEDTVRASARVVESVILLSELPWRTQREEREIFAHERVHVLQRDQLFVTTVEPAAARIAREIPGLDAAYRYVDVHFTDLVFDALKIPFPEYERRPWELEAFYLSRR